MIEELTKTNDESMMNRQDLDRHVEHVQSMSTQMNFKQDNNNRIIEKNLVKTE